MGESRSQCSSASSGPCTREDSQTSCTSRALGYSPSMNVEFHKAVATMVRVLGSRGLEEMFPPPTICYYDVGCRPGVRGHVALTVDDAPCSSPDAERSMMSQVQDLLATFSAHATF